MSALDFMDASRRTEQADTDLSVGQVKLRYGYICQEGFYPDKEHVNQDTCRVVERYEGQDDQLWVGVFDGHGEDSEVSAASRGPAVPPSFLPLHSPPTSPTPPTPAPPTLAGRADAGFNRPAPPQHISGKVADCLHENLSELRKSRNYKVHGGADAQVPEPSGSAYFKAFLKTHDDLIAELGKVAYMAGTTAVTGHFVGDMAHIANVGDSRAVLGKTAGDRWRVVEITKDQTGFRADERERAKNEAHMPIEFLTLGMSYGEEEISEDFGDEDSANAADPPRIFIVGRKFPASAFTRSLGDALGKMAGVCAYPEIHSIKLTQEDT